MASSEFTFIVVNGKNLAIANNKHEDGKFKKRSSIELQERINDIIYFNQLFDEHKNNNLDYETLSKFREEKKINITELIYIEQLCNDCSNNSCYVHDNNVLWKNNNNLNNYKNNDVDWGDFIGFHRNS